MNAKTLYLALQDVDEELLRRSEITCSSKSARPLRWTALAACLCLVLALTFPAARDFLRYKGGEPTDPIAALEYNGRFYEAVDDPVVLEKYGLPRQITADMAGQHLSYLKSDGGDGYLCSASQTDIELYQYAPAACDAVYVLRHGNAYKAAIFCNFYQFDSNTSCELTELYRVYAIEDAADISSITEVDWHRNKVIGSPITDRQEIAEFYGITCALWSYGNDDFQRKMFGDCISEEDQLKLHHSFAEDSRVLRVETTNGLRFYLNFYPSYNWIYGGGTMSYFRIEEDMHHWLDHNFS